MRAITYARVSTDAQEKDGTSLDTQERACIQFAMDHGWPIIESVREAASGYTLDRPGIAQVRRLLHQGDADVVIAYAVDRLSRNQNHIGVLFDEVQQAGARLEFITEKFEDTAIGRFILSARAFIAEVEREKIAERTMRGKLERARSGRIPQAMGKGCYGYSYNPGTGHREIDVFQAQVVRRIFRRYTETRSFSAVSAELNEEGLLAFSGGRWYPLTIRRMLRNESYTGRLVYRRTKWVATRNAHDGRRRRHPVERPVEEWIDIEGASPRIIEDALWFRVQQILDDPERTRQRPSARFYPLRGRVKCGMCGGAMVGRTLSSKGRTFTYYACRHAYDKHTKRTCSSRYVRQDELERGVWREISQVLSSPSVVLNELQHQSGGGSDEREVRRVEREIASFREREKRLVRLYTFGEIDEEFVREEGACLRHQRLVLEARLKSLRPAPLPMTAPVDADALTRACSAVAAWLDQAGPAERVQVLEALQIGVVATKEAAAIKGVLPTDPPRFAVSEQSSLCK
jgi:site-specific DNA recombinase